MNVAVKTQQLKREVAHTSTGEPVSVPEDAEIGERFSIYAIIQDPLTGYVLFVRKDANSLWELPGGEVENGETNPEALVRECLEEAGAYINIVKPFEKYPHGKGLLAKKRRNENGIIIPKEYEFCYSYQRFMKCDLVAFHQRSANPEMTHIQFHHPHGVEEHKCKMIFQPIIRRLRVNC